jgi:hypothetical protein
MNGVSVRARRSCGVAAVLGSIAMAACETAPTAATGDDNGTGATGADAAQGRVDTVADGSRRASPDTVTVDSPAAAETQDTSVEVLAEVAPPDVAPDLQPDVLLDVAPDVPPDVPLDVPELPKPGCLSQPPGACDDKNPCTVGDKCSGGTCKGGAATVCDDGKACSKDSCDVTKGCVFDTSACPVVLTYADVQPIFQKYCSGCHSGGGSGGHNIASSYDDALKDSYYCPGKTKGYCAWVRMGDGMKP